jgi:hypothetical protein
MDPDWLSDLLKERGNIGDAAINNVMTKSA